MITAVVLLYDDDKLVGKRTVPGAASYIEDWEPMHGLHGRVVHADHLGDLVITGWDFHWHYEERGPTDASA